MTQSLEGSDVQSSTDRSQTRDEAVLGEDTTRCFTGSMVVYKAPYGPGCAKVAVGCTPWGAGEELMACITAANWVPSISHNSINL